MIFRAQRWHQDFPAGGAEGHSILGSMAVGESRKNKGGRLAAIIPLQSCPLKEGVKTFEQSSNPEKMNFNRGKMFCPF